MAKRTAASPPSELCKDRHMTIFIGMLQLGRLLMKKTAYKFSKYGVSGTS